MKDAFHLFSEHTARAVGSPWAFLIALLIVVSWFASGPYFHYSDTWQLIINTGTTIVTFLMVFYMLLGSLSLLRVARQRFSALG